MLKVAIVLLAVGIAAAMVVVIVGFILPVGHVVSRNTIVAASPERVFSALTDVERFPDWRSDVKRVEASSAAPLRWVEEGRNGRIAFERVEADAGRRLVTKIADAALPFGGTWTYELTPSGEGTMVTITERGEVYNPVFRFMARFVFGYTATIETFLKDLGAGVR